MIRVVQYGVGPIGAACVRAVLARSRRGLLELVGAVDTDPAKAGRDAGELAGGAATGILVSPDAERTLRETEPDVVLHTAGSALDRIQSQIEPCLRAGAHVVSSSEELLFPFERHAGIARSLDEAARAGGVALLGTGVNPGYVMDTLALMATGTCVEVESVHVERVVDVALRRQPLQHKVGAGLELAEFERRRQAGTIGHMGLRESLLFVAHGLGWEPERVEESLEPVVAERAVKTPQLSVAPGRVAGVHHAATGWFAGRAALVLDLKMFAGAPDPHDAIRVAGDPPIDLRIHGGVFGDTATVGALVNAIPRLIEAEPGLRTMQDLSVLRSAGGGPSSA